MFNSKSSQILFFPCWIKNRSPLPITKSGALVVCEGYLKITRVLNVWLNEESNISKYQRNKILHLIQRAVKFCSFHVRLTISVLCQ